jgi:hypothetical protein
MLYSIDSESHIKTIPHRKDYDRWRNSITDEDYQAICDELRSLISGSEIKTSSWIPGSDWTGTVYEPIYHACNEDEVASAKFFGLIVWHVFLDHEEFWSFGHYKLGDVPIAGLTYFRISPPR